jgi:positive regulator of sigma E activity
MSVPVLMLLVSNALLNPHALSKLMLLLLLLFLQSGVFLVFRYRYWLHEDGELTVILMNEATIGYHRKMALQICDLGTLKYH